MKPVNEPKTFKTINRFKYVIAVGVVAAFVAPLISPTPGEGLLILVLVVFFGFGIRTWIDVRAKSLLVVLMDDQIEMSYLRKDKIRIRKSDVIAITTFKSVKHPWAEGGLLIKTRTGSHKIFRDYLSDYEGLKTALSNSGWQLKE